MKMFRPVLYAILLAIFLATNAVIYVSPASAGASHYRCAIIVECWQDHVLVLSRIDILYPGIPEPGIFTDVILFSPFTDYTTDGESHLYIFPSEPVNLSGPPRRIQVTTFKAILNWGMPGEPTPFTFVEYDVSGFQVSGIIYNLEELVGGITLLINKLGLLAPYVGLTSTIIVTIVATGIYVNRVRRGRTRNT